MPRSPTLLRELGFLSATALVVSNMVGTGIFATTGFMAGDLGDARLILLIWLAGALFSFCGALTYSELGINFPSSGGDYVYLTEAYGPVWGFMTGWISFFAGFSAPIAAAALAFAAYLGYFFPALQPGHAWLALGSGAVSLRLGPAQIAGSAVICLFTVWNCFGLARVARLQNILTGTKLAVLAAFILLALLASTGDWSHFSTHAVRTSTNSLAVQSVISLVWIMVAYSGWNAATYIAEELRSPRRTLPLALAAGTGIVAALYLALNVVYIYATPLETMKGVIPVASQAASRLFGPGIAGGFTALLTISITATINAMITIGPRVYYAMARNGAFFRVAARVHPRWRTPVPAILAQGALAALLTLTPFPQLVLYIGFSLTFFSALAVASVFRFRRRPHWQRLHALDLAFPLAPGAYLLMAGCMTIYGFVWQPVASFSAAVTVAVGALAYRWHFRHTAR